MKKMVLAFCLVCMGAAVIAAKDLDSEVKNAVAKLSSTINSRYEVWIGDIFIDGTQTSGALSRELSKRIRSYAKDTGKLDIVERAKTRGVERPKASTSYTAHIEGTYTIKRSDVDIYLELIQDPDGRLIGSSIFTISKADLGDIEILPPQIKTVEEIKAQEEIFTPQPDPTPVAPVTASALSIEAWTDSGNTFIVGDKMKINLFANKDCYVKVYHIDANKKMQLLFPNQLNRSNAIKANQVTAIPQLPVEIVIEPPIGLEFIWVQVSTEPFIINESEFTAVKNVTRAEVAATRGASLQVNPSGKAAETAETQFGITVLDANYSDESFSYRKPANMNETVQAMRSEVVRQGGTFSGNEREGMFICPAYRGNYRVAGDRFTINLRYSGDQSAAGTRGAGFSFVIDKPRNMAQAVQSVRSGIEGSGGTFSGNEQQGNFRASGIAGQYNVSDRVSVSISDKPALIPNALIEKEIKSYFSGK